MKLNSVNFYVSLYPRILVGSRCFSQMKINTDARVISQVRFPVAVLVRDQVRNWIFPTIKD
jgi:hypothetical protein